MNQVKLNELIKSKVINIPVYVLKIFKAFNLTVDEMILLLFLYDKDGEVFNPNLIADTLNMDMITLMKTISKLSDKKILNITTKVNGSKVKEEIIDLSLLFDKITIKMMEEMNSQKEEETSIYEIINNEFGRKLTPMENEMVDNWKKNGYSNELIIEAVREATLNGVSSLRYIDKILFEWNKKGFKTKEDVKNKNKKEVKGEKIEIYNCDWLDSDEEL